MPTERTIAFGRRHRRDLSKWPEKCNACLVDTAIGMFEAVDAKPPEVLRLGKCALCSTVLGKHHYSKVPGVGDTGAGDLCLVCHATWSRGRDGK